MVSLQSGDLQIVDGCVYMVPVLYMSCILCVYTLVTSGHGLHNASSTTVCTQHVIHESYYKYMYIICSKCV